MSAGTVVTAFTTALALLVPGTASAHVTVSSDDAPAGGYGVLTFRVPTESPTAATTGLEVLLPEEDPLGSVSVEPTPGWTATVEYRDVTPPVADGHGGSLSRVASKVVWIASGPGIAPGEFERFSVLAGPLPHRDSVSFPAVQTYSDGSTAEWVQIANSGTEADKPAPSLTLAAHAADVHTAAPVGPSLGGQGVVEWTALIAALVALGVSIFAALRGRRTSA